MARCSTVAAVLVPLLAIACYAFFCVEEARIHAPSRIDFRSPAWFHECAQWDPAHHRFLVSFLGGGLAQINTTQRPPQAHILVQDPALKGYSTLGFKIDHARNRVLIAIADIRTNRFSALAAYDTGSWERIFLVELAGAERLSMADDVAFDSEGNAYVTDAMGALIWKVSADGSQATTLTRSEEFKLKPRSLLLRTVTLNGIAYHPGGFLLVSHTGGMAIFKVSLDGQDVRRVEVRGEPVIGDGIDLVRPHQLAVAGLWSGVALVESEDDWETAQVTHRYSSPKHRLATAVTVKNDSVFVNYAFPIPYAFTIGEAVFTPL